MNAPSLKPRGLFIIEEDKFDFVYGPAARAALTSGLDLPSEPFAPKRFESGSERLAGIEVIVGGWGLPRLDERVLAQLPDLKIVFSAAGSIRFFMTDAAWDRGVRVVAVPHVNAVPVAEFTFAQIVLSLKRAFSQAVALRRTREFAREACLIPGTFGSTVGLISLGEIGRQVAKRLATLAVTVLAYDPHVSEERAGELGVTLVSLDELFARADVVSCHAPWLPATERMIRGSHFDALKPGATFINTARGAVVAEDEMTTALKRRPDLFVLLDVTHPMPPAPDSPLFALPNVFLTPHIAGSMDFECRRMGDAIAADVERYLNGAPPAGEVSRAQAALLA